VKGTNQTKDGYWSRTPSPGGYQDSLFETEREAQQIDYHEYQDQCNRCDSKGTLCAFFVGSRTALISALCHHVLYAHTPTTQLAAIFRFSCLFFQFVPRSGPLHSLSALLL